MIKYFIPLITLCLLTACVSPEEQAERQQMRIDRDVATCKSYGLTPGSEAFGSCRLQLDLERERRYRYNDPYYYGGVGNHGSHIGVGRRF